MIAETAFALTMMVNGAQLVPHVRDQYCTCREVRKTIRIAVPTCMVSEFEPNRSYRVANLYTEDGTPKSGQVVVECVVNQ
jgi:hypothetical protein